jgi:hypothetical protein
MVDLTGINAVPFRSRNTEPQLWFAPSPKNLLDVRRNKRACFVAGHHLGSKQFVIVRQRMTDEVLQFDPNRCAQLQSYPVPGTHPRSYDQASLLRTAGVMQADMLPHLIEREYVRGTQLRSVDVRHAPLNRFFNQTRVRQLPFRASAENRWEDSMHPRIQASCSSAAAMDFAICCKMGECWLGEVG